MSIRIIKITGKLNSKKAYIAFLLKVGEKTVKRLERGMREGKYLSREVDAEIGFRCWQYADYILPAGDRDDSELYKLADKIDSLLEGWCISGTGGPEFIIDNERLLEGV